MVPTQPLALDAEQTALTDQIFGHAEILYGSHADFGAAAGPLRNLIGFLVKNGSGLLANPKLLSFVVMTASALSPAAAPVLAELAPVLAQIGPLIEFFKQLPAANQPTAVNQPAFPNPVVIQGGGSDVLP